MTITVTITFYAGLELEEVDVKAPSAVSQKMAAGTSEYILHMIYRYMQHTYHILV